MGPTKIKRITSVCTRINVFSTREMQNTFILMNYIKGAQQINEHTLWNFFFGDVAFSHFANISHTLCSKIGKHQVPSTTYNRHFGMKEFYLIFFFFRIALNNVDAFLQCIFLLDIYFFFYFCVRACVFLRFWHECRWQRQSHIGCNWITVWLVLLAGWLV